MLASSEPTIMATMLSSPEPTAIHTALQQSSYPTVAPSILLPSFQLLVWKYSFLLINTSLLPSSTSRSASASTAGALSTNEEGCFVWSIEQVLSSAGLLVNDVCFVSAFIAVDNDNYASSMVMSTLTEYVWNVSMDIIYIGAANRTSIHHALSTAVFNGEMQSNIHRFSRSITPAVVSLASSLVCVTDRVDECRQSILIRSPTPSHAPSTVMVDDESSAALFSTCQQTSTQWTSFYSVPSYMVVLVMLLLSWMLLTCWKVVLMMTIISRDRVVEGRAIYLSSRSMIDWGMLTCCLLRIAYFILPIVFYFMMVAHGGDSSTSEDGDDDDGDTTDSWSPRLLFPCLEFSYLSDVDPLMHSSGYRWYDNALVSYLLVRILFYPCSLVVGKSHPCMHASSHTQLTPTI
jgi:hypothetical protein